MSSPPVHDGEGTTPVSADTDDVPEREEVGETTYVSPPEDATDAGVGPVDISPASSADDGGEGISSSNECIDHVDDDRQTAEQVASPPVAPETTDEERIKSVGSVDSAASSLSRRSNAPSLSSGVAPAPPSVPGEVSGDSSMERGGSGGSPDSPNRYGMSSASFETDDDGHRIRIGGGDGTRMEDVPQSLSEGGDDNSRRSQEGCVASTNGDDSADVPQQHIQRQSTAEREAEMGESSFWSSFDEADAAGSAPTSPASARGKGVEVRPPPPSRTGSAASGGDEDSSQRRRERSGDGAVGIDICDEDSSANGQRADKKLSHDTGPTRPSFADISPARRKGLANCSLSRASPSSPAGGTSARSVFRISSNDSMGIGGEEDISRSWRPFEDGAPFFSESEGGGGRGGASGGNGTGGTSPLHQQAQDYGVDGASSAELELARRLDDEYEQALEDREVAWKARYTSVRQSACLSITVMILYLVLGCWFYHDHADWDRGVADSLLFTIYTITTVGYGSHDMPTEAGFQLFTVFYILVGIASLTVLAAHMYQFLVLEATKMQFLRDRADLNRRAVETADMTAATEGEFTLDDIGGGIQTAAQQRRRRFMMELHAHIVHDRPFLERWIDQAIQTYDATRRFLRSTPAGRVISVLLPFVGLILFGAIVMGILERWSPVEAIYWAVVTLTTVGFGDYVPTTTLSVWFCIFYLPSSLFFMSFFLANVAKSYIRLHALHVARLEHRMRLRIKRARDVAERRQSSLNSQRGHGNGDGGDGHHHHHHGGGMVGDHGGDASSDDLSASGGSNHGTTTTFFSGGSDGGRIRRRGNNRAAVEGFETLPTGDANLSPTHTSAQLFGSPEASLHGRNGTRHRESVVYNSLQYSGWRGTKTLAGGSSVRGSSDAAPPSGGKMHTTKAVLKSLRRQKERWTATATNALGARATSLEYNPDFDANFNMVGDPSAKMEAVDGSNSVAATAASDTVSSNSRSNSPIPPPPFSSTPKASSNQPPGHGPPPRKSSQDNVSIVRKPSFATRMMVQERLARLIATDVAGYQSDVIIKEDTLSITIDSLKDIADKWMIPRRARKAFRAVSFQCIFFAGEHDLITLGAEALFRLNPLEFHSLFSPLLAAFGDADTMESWLSTTNVLADVELRRPNDGGGEEGEDDSDFEEDGKRTPIGNHVAEAATRGSEAASSDGLC